MKTTIVRTAGAWALAATALVAFPARAVLDVEQPWNPCSDAYELRNIAFDARMTAVMMFYKGFIQNLPDGGRRACLRAHVLEPGHSAVIDKTMNLIEGECLPIEAAAARATEGLCQ